MLLMGILFFGAALNYAYAEKILFSSDQQTINHPVVKTVEYFGQLVRQRTNGELSVVVKTDGALGGELDTLRHVKEGSQAFARVGLGSLSDRIPAAELASLPYLFRSTDHMWRVLKGPFGKRLDSEMLANGYVRIMYMDSGARNFYCKKPLRSQEDFKNLRVRVLQSKVFESLIENLGAKSIPTPFNKVGDAFQNGQIDCAEGGVVAYMGMDLYKLAPYLMLDEHMLIPEVFVMSKKVWDGLTSSQQEIIKQAAGESSEYMSKLWKDQESAAMSAAKKSGVTIISRSQISMIGIEAQAIKTYNSFIKNPGDLEAVMSIVTAK